MTPLRVPCSLAVVPAVPSAAASFPPARLRVEKKKDEYFEVVVSQPCTLVVDTKMEVPKSLQPSWPRGTRMLLSLHRPVPSVLSMSPSSSLPL